MLIFIKRFRNFFYTHVSTDLHTFTKGTLNGNLIFPAAKKIYLPQVPGTKSVTLRKKCSYSELFWSAYFPHFPAFRLNTKYLSVFSPTVGKCGKNADQNNSEYGHILGRVISSLDYWIL